MAPDPIDYKPVLVQVMACCRQAESYCMIQCWSTHDDVIKWKHFPRYWPFVRGIQRSPVISPHKGQWRGALMFSLICAGINGSVNNREAGDLRCHRVHYDAIVIHDMICLLAGCIYDLALRYRDGIMCKEFTSVLLVYSTFCSAYIKENTKALRHWPLWGEFTGCRWIPGTKGQ